MFIGGEVTELGAIGLYANPELVELAGMNQLTEIRSLELSGALAQCRVNWLFERVEVSGTSSGSDDSGTCAP